MGRDVLKKLNFKLVAASDTNDNETKAIQEILNIGDCQITNDPMECLDINTSISRESQLELKEIFKSEYLQADFSGDPKVEMELKLTLREHQPFHFAPRILLYSEKDQLREILNRLLDKEIL